jgi:phage anti-repressor protein
MTTQLIPVFAGELSGAPVQLVDARLLHTFLEVGKDFSNWIKARIQDYGFIESQDFLLAKFGEQNGSGGHNKIDYFLSIDMAKELGMIERSAKGRQIRRYFLDMERIAQAPSQDYIALQGKYNAVLEKHLEVLEQENDRLTMLGQTTTVKRWTPDEDKILLEMKANGSTNTEIGLVLRRGRDAVRYRYSILNAKRGGAQ